MLRSGVCVGPMTAVARRLAASRPRIPPLSDGPVASAVAIRRAVSAVAQPVTQPTHEQQHPLPSRRESIKTAKPFSEFLTDTFHRQHDYLRISISERCNLRCVYCMPEEGVPLSPDRDVLTSPEIFLLSSVFVSQGVTKIRLTGGEPTVRKDFVPLMQQIGTLRPHGLKEICITTNGISLHRKLDSLVESGLTGVNLSLDTLDPWQFQIMTRRKGFEAVQRSIDRILELNRLGAGVKLKINCVVMRGVNDREIIPFVEMTREKDVEVRFIEYMPFDGNKWSEGKMFGYQEMLDLIKEKYPSLEKVRDHRNDTSKTWRIPGFAGRIGFITSMTHNFCGTCNRLRITSDGNLKVCLFGNAEVSLRDILRKSNGGEPIDEAAFEAVKKLEMDRRQGLVSGEQPLGIAPHEAELLDVIGMAVKRKKAKHAGMGELKNMKNRPMILIDSIPVSTFTGAMPARTRRLVSDAIPSQCPTTPRFGARMFSAAARRLKDNGKDDDDGHPRLTHVDGSGAAHMVSIADKAPTSRTATAACIVRFTRASTVRLVAANQLKKGDVLGVARVAGIMAAKRTAELIPLCHPIAITSVSVDLRPEEDCNHNDNGDGDAEGGSGSGSSGGGDGSGVGGKGEGGGRVHVRATVRCDGRTGVEMEALTAASVAALTVYDMCKAVDKGMSIEGLRVVLKEGGRSGRWEME